MEQLQIGNISLNTCIDFRSQQELIQKYIHDKSQHSEKNIQRYLHVKKDF